jgi:transcriptional regulator with XRE-family HTH domain
MTSLESRIRGAALGALRRLKRWPGLRLAEAVGTSEAMVSHYETGSKELSPERFHEIGQAMGYSRRRLEAAIWSMISARRAVPSA